MSRETPLSPARGMPAIDESSSGEDRNRFEGHRETARIRITAGPPARVQGKTRPVGSIAENTAREGHPCRAGRESLVAWSAPSAVEAHVSPQPRATSHAPGVAGKA